MIATKTGFAGSESEEFPFDPGTEGKPQTPEPIRLESGVELSGIVVDHLGRMVAGAWVQPHRVSPRGGGSADRVQSTRTDENGRFTIRDIPLGVTRLSVLYGRLIDSHTYLADGSREEFRIRLPPPEFADRVRAAGAPGPAPSRPASRLRSG